MLIAHSTIVFLRYMFLEIQRRYAVDIRSHGNIFYRCCDEIEEVKLSAALSLVFSLFEEYLGANFSEKKSAFDD